MIKHILAAVMLLVGSASAQWLGQARQTAVLTNGLSTIASPRSNVQQVVEWINNNWPTNIALTNVYLNAGNIYFTNFWTGTNQITYQQTASNNLTVTSNSIMSAIAGLTNNYIKGTNIAGAVAYSDSTWRLKTPKYFFSAHRVSNNLTSGSPNIWYEVLNYTSQTVANVDTFNLASGRFTAPTTGWYSVHASITRYSELKSTNYFRAGISINANTNFNLAPFIGVQIGAASWTTNNPQATSFSGSLFTKLLKDDTVSLVFINSHELGTGSNYIESAAISGYMVQEAGYDQ